VQTGLRKKPLFLYLPQKNYRLMLWSVI